jgi:membrane associated rhomboid family serine protease
LEKYITFGKAVFQLWLRYSDRMRQPPKWTEFIKYPVTAGTGLLAIGVTLAWWAKLDVSPLFESAMVRRGEVWRLITSIFPHIDVLHLIFNLYWLWVFGTLVEEVYGHFKTAGLFLLFAVGPNALEYAFSVGGVGLSGVGYGLFGLLWVLSRRDERFRDAIDTRTIQLFVVWFFICVLLTVANVMQVGNIAHGAGAVLGILTGFAITMPERRATVVTSIGLILAFGFWASSVGRPKVNFSAYGGYEECKAGDDAMRAQHYDEALKWLQIAVTYRKPQMACLTDLGFTYQELNRGDQALAAYQKSAAMGDAESAYYVAALYEKGHAGVPKDVKKAAFWYGKAAQQGATGKPNPDILNNVAWALATSSEPGVRSPAAALEYAQKAIAAEQGHPRPHILDTLAEAYYANERYEDAVKIEKQAIGLASASEKENYQKSLEKYELAFAGGKQTASVQ